MTRIALGLSLALQFVTALHAEPEKQAEPYSHHDGTDDGKRSIGGSGPMLRFELGEPQTVRGIRIHGSRYGLPKAPNEKIQIHFVSEDESEVITTRMVPYSRFKRGEQEWVVIIFDKPVPDLSTFWVSIDPRAHQTKGVYFSYDASTAGKFSRIGIPGAESKPANFEGDWMIEVLPAEK